jgi:hypothetical protein
MGGARYSRAVEVRAEGLEQAVLGSFCVWSKRGDELGTDLGDTGCDRFGLRPRRAEVDNSIGRSFDRRPAGPLAEIFFRFLAARRHHVAVAVDAPFPIGIARKAVRWPSITDQVVISDGQAVTKRHPT